MAAEVLKKFKKNASEEIWIAVTEYKERELLDMRIYFRSVEDNEMKPTKRGVSIALAKAPELLVALESITANTEMDTTAGIFEKNETESVRVALKEFKGHKLVDVRTYFRPDGSNDLVPSQKGVAFRFALLDEMKDAVRRAVQALRGVRPDEGTSAA